MQTVSQTQPDLTPAEARERIVQAAFRLFGRQGYTQTSVQEIAAAAGVKKPVLYYYFGSKEGLYRALVEQSAYLLRRLVSEATAPCGADEPIGARMGRLAETLIGLARDNKDPVRFFFAHFLAADEDRPACDTGALETEPRHLLRQLAQEGIARGELRGDAADLERLVMGGIQYSIINYLRRPEEEPLDPGLGERIVRAALAGFAVR